MLYARKEVLLDVKGVNFSYGPKLILRDINFQIQDIVRPDTIQGQIVALIGQSGAGKSTLFNLMAGVKAPDSGTILQGVSQKPVKIGDMGMVYQDYYIYPWRRVKVILQKALNKNPNPTCTVEDIANDFRLTEHLDKFPKELSGGQRQRVAIAEQILGGSEFLLLDEPFSGLDVITIDKVLAMLAKTSCIDELKTLVIVSHDLRNAVALADTVYILSKEANKEGGTIVKTIDLIARDLAWHKDIKEMPQFNEVIKEIKSLL